MDVQQAIKSRNLMIPTGTAKIGDVDCMVDMAIEAGSVHINDNSFDDDPNAPFGGFKGSGYGKENGRYSVADMTELKWVTVQLGERKLAF